MARTKDRPANQLRLIGGRHRGRRLSFPDQPGLRPTSDRVRETLFNWVAPLIEGARCLDLFAGSGALGFEALSRGAGEVVMVERAAAVARQLRANAGMLGASSLQVHEADALVWLERGGEPFDLVLLDPPFAEGLLAPAIERLGRHGWLAPEARVYLEAPIQIGFPPLPEEWELIRDKTAGQVRYGLARVGSV
ncbi:16S rRNA (guanine(966)-N(2))-methyltransferase RsmD [Allochromatium vinosum]|uniref:Ribosomal RNA small subunit methyltransferase D n=1 Tax=Allochromatium vinosum (strain ATCC 17899 / DSM 180 / NBRC 103801 / NCIMB 10441 / D) TaxID=572477 RepID=D3RQV7_ALLVD|nr:16S rRNA (guanine(966)-N(2))-methyltransferase RsmD [Allochromatium vinosum]ADC63791.1 methyltransferase [Allochromatium vinosum DSM 180]